MENIDLINELVQAIKEISPLVWEAAERKNQALVYTGLFWAVFITLVASVLVKIFMYMVGKSQEPTESIIDDKTEWIVAAGLCFIGVLTCAFLTAGILADVWQRFYAPEYYTILVLMDLIPQGK